MRKFLAIEEIAEILARDLSIKLHLQNFSQVLYYLRNSSSRIMKIFDELLQNCLHNSATFCIT